MPASDGIKQLFAKKHGPAEPVIRTEMVTPEMLEAFLFSVDAFDAYARLNSKGDNFIVVPKWIVEYGKDGVTYLLCLTLLITTGRGEPVKVDIPAGSRLWDTITTAAEIKDVVVKIPYPAQV